MTRIESLIEKARRLKEKGLTTGEIADELNVSRETALWLLTKATEDISPPSDVYIEWRTFVKSPYRMRNIAKSLVDMVLDVIEDEIEVVIGIATSGIPIATMIAEELNADLALYYPRKLKWENEEREIAGTLSENYAKVDRKNCIAIDDIITTGSTLREVAEYVSKKEGKLLCACVVIDKRGLEDIGGAPVLSMLKVTRI
ncbi:Orotate phosphoribosyltransferase-like protein [Archaeoglobus sulfaticallidus PM70-1]|uniref:Transcriptional regulator GfcR n=1 Tax=Archaeoglobus sulfaticallidus PM70-1 TaxID=387631 RepID=N0BEK0_9EURY|nr:orotate phosphoribosyltransferase-like protein [Archaeoglobus sulfaticallidus]AGK62044.1 Orotate phosphoribosyltransferase-like protein [Archaeoglobus sulfaticallidus PM70-1]